MNAMKSSLPLLAIALVFGSCTTAYKSGQTPDDVYYSPTRPQDEYVRTERRDDRRRVYEEELRDDRYLRMKVRDRRYANLYDDYYSYNPYYYHYYNSFLIYNSPWSPYNYWGYYYGPSRGVICYTPTSRPPLTGKPRVFDLGVYNPNPAPTNGGKGRVFGSTNTRSNAVYYGNANYGRPTNTDSYRGSNNNAGGFLRDVMSGGSGSGSSNSGGGIKGSSSSGSSSSGSSSNAPARRF
jgi:hypothetical protein